MSTKLSDYNRTRLAGIKAFADEHGHNALTGSDALWLIDEIERLRAALTEITELDLEGDASLADAISVAEQALEPAALGR